MIRSLLRAVIHNATVTGVEATWPASLRIDPVLLRAAEILPLEEVEIVNLATGERFRSFAQPAEEGRGDVILCSAMRHPVRAGDIVSILSFGWLHDGQTIAHAARSVTVDASNRPTAVEEMK